ncbi:MAG: ribokinase [Pseudomonadota bacterium]
MSGVVVLGSINIDYVLSTTRLPSAGETVPGRDFRVVMGGKGANQAVACARTLGSCTLIGCVGDDAYGREAVAGFANDRIRTDTITVVPGARTGAALIFIDDTGENCIGVSGEANEQLTPERVDAQEEAIASADYLLMQLEVPLAAVQRAAEIARNAGTRVILNPAPAREPLPELLLGQIDIMTPNEPEARVLLGDSSIDDETAARRLRDQGVRTVVLTRGSEGVVVLSNSGLTLLPAETVEAIDTVGAGDCFSGVLAAELAVGQTLEQAARVANRAASIAVTRAGAQDAMPFRKEFAGD